MSGLERLLSEGGLRFVDADPDPELACPEPLIDALHARTKATPELLDLLLRRIPIDDAVQGTAAFPCYRLPRHERSLYAVLRTDTPPARIDDEVLAFKGIDPLRGDFAATVASMSRKPFRGGYLSILDHFPIAEGKLPGAVIRREAALEARASWAVHLDHLETFGDLAHLPLPLYVHRMTGDETARYLAQVEPHLASRARSRAGELGHGRLCALVSWYPAAQLRADFYDNDAQGEINTMFGEVPSIKATVDRWVELCTRLLVLGYLPVTPWSKRLGACLDPGNACLDGGFADADSIVAFADAPGDPFFFDSMALTVATFLETVETLLGSLVGDDANNRIPLTGFVAGRFRAALAAHRAAGRDVDPRVTRFLEPSSFDELTFLLLRHRLPFFPA